MNSTVLNELSLHAPEGYESLLEALKLMFLNLIVTNKWANLSEGDRDDLACSYYMICSILETLHSTTKAR